VWAAIDVDTGELLAIRATWSRSSMDALLFLRRVLEACTNKPVFVVEGGPWYSWAFRELGLQHCRGAFGDRSGVERFFGSLKRRTSASFKDINAGRSRIASLDGLMNMSFAYYNGLRFHKGIGRAPDRASHYHREGRLPVLRRPRGIDISRLGSRSGGQQAG
jgi:transposase-like protein